MASDETYRQMMMLFIAFHSYVDNDNVQGFKETFCAEDISTKAKVQYFRIVGPIMGDFLEPAITKMSLNIIRALVEYKWYTVDWVFEKTCRSKLTSDQKGEIITTLLPLLIKDNSLEYCLTSENELLREVAKKFHQKKSVKINSEEF